MPVCVNLSTTLSLLFRFLNQLDLHNKLNTNPLNKNIHI